MPAFIGYEKLAPSQVRIREIGTDMFFGPILRDEKAQIRRFNIEHNAALVVQVTFNNILFCLRITLQILLHPETLEEDDVILFIRKRIVDYRSYSEPREMLFIANQYPQIDDLKAAILQFEGLDLDLQELELVKYFPQEFEWLYISQEYIESENEKKKTGKKKNKKGSSFTLSLITNSSSLTM